MKTPYPLPLLRTLPLREQPGARVRSDSTVCTALELLETLERLKRLRGEK